MDYKDFQKGVYIDNGSVLLEMPVAKRVQNFIWKLESKRRWKRLKKDGHYLYHHDCYGDLSSLSTRELMKLRKSAYRRGNVDEINSILNTREHIRNKKEGQLYRKMMSKRGK